MKIRNFIAIAAISFLAVGEVAFADVVKLLSHYKGEDNPINDVWVKRTSGCVPYKLEYDKKPRCAVHYLTPNERAAYKLTWDDKANVWKDAHNQVYDTETAFKALGTKKRSVTGFDLAAEEVMQGRAGIYVIGLDDALYVSVAQEAGQFNHSSFLAGGDVKAAGQIIITHGKITAINNASGHYQPSAEAMHAALLKFTDKQYDPSRVWCLEITNNSTNKVKLNGCAKVEPLQTNKQLKAKIKDINKTTPSTHTFHDLNDDGLTEEDMKLTIDDLMGDDFDIGEEDN